MIMAVVALQGMVIHLVSMILILKSLAIPPMLKVYIIDLI